MASCANPPPKDPLKYGLTLNVKLWGSKTIHDAEEKKREKEQKSFIRHRSVSGQMRREMGCEMIAKNLKATRI